MNDTRLVTSQLLKQLLSTSSPELGARLKQHLNTAFIARGLGNFDEKSLGFSKFSDYLLKVHGDLVTLNRDDSFSDILVTLRSGQQSPSATIQVQVKAENPPASAVIRSDVWQAFANPDPERKRFFHKETHKIVHYVEGKHVAERLEVESAPDQYLEIPFIPQEVQAGWMKEFLGSISVPANERAVLETLVDKAYSSAVNVTFSRALGSHSNAWRLFRTNRVTATIESWAKEVGVLLKDLRVSVTESSVKTSQASLQAAAATMQPSEPLSPLADQLPPRQQVLKLLELLSDQDISQLVLPTLLSTILIKSRL